MPFSVDVLQPQTELPLGGTLDLVIRLNRTMPKSSDETTAKQFTAPVKMSFRFFLMAAYPNLSSSSMVTRAKECFGFQLAQMLLRGNTNLPQSLRCT